MNTSEAPSLHDIVAAVAAHVEANPLATDSAAGVARWWLGARWAHVGVDRVEAALGLLVDRGVLRRVTLADDTVLYARALTRQ